MQTFFEKDQLADLDFKRSNEILRACVHCGFCTATCPTYQVLGDELDSPRGRIYLIKEMLESGRKPDKKTVTHIDRCLSCLACMTTCPSGVHYMHLVDHARAYIEDNYKRPLDERFLRWLLSRVLPYPMRFRIALILAKIAKSFSWLIPDARLKAMIKMAPQKIPPISLNDDPQSFFPDNLIKMRVALMTGCAQRALDTDINDATIRVLNRFGCEVVIAEGQGCCGSAGTYNLLQPKISDELKNRKVQSLEAKKPDIIAAGNIGCMMQIASSTNTPVVHTVELVDWATGGPKPTKLNGRL